MNEAHRAAIFSRLREANPEPTTELDYGTPFELLIAVMLSAQATDVGVNRATAKLFPGARTPAAMLDLGLDRLKGFIRTIGLFNTKAENILKTCRILLDEHGGEVPRRREALGSAARRRPQDRQRGAEHRLRRADHRRGHAYLPGVQPHGDRPRQDAAQGGGTRCCARSRTTSSAARTTG